ncbi:MAG: hypothetical protein ACXVPU_04095 [Bacteroidia bacterium]
MKNKFLKVSATFLCSFIFNLCGFSQETATPAKLVYTIQVDGLLNQDQVTRLDNIFKRKIGIYSDDINFESKKIIVKTTEEVTYKDVCDILSTEKLKAQNYIVNKE